MIHEKLIEKIKNTSKKIGADLKEYKASTDGYYLKNSDSCIKLNHIFNWTQTFFLGNAFLAYVQTKDNNLLKWVNSYYDTYYNKVFETPFETMHDLGFLYSPYAVAMYEYSGDINMKKIGIKAADELSKRFIPNGGYIRAWGRMDNNTPGYVDEELAKDHFFTESNGLAIVDCMMNIPLLFWASKVTGHPYYKNIAIMHADTTLKYFVRDDYSICHAYRFDPSSGKPVGEANYCGYSIGSHWARGTSWAIYGFAIAYGYTKKKEYLDAAYNLLIKYMSECNGKVSVWDFRLPENEEKNIDTSAHAVVLCAIIEMMKYKKSDNLKEYKNIIKNNLSEYIDFSQNNEGILKEQNGRHHYASYGDYFLLESMIKEDYDITVW